MKKVTTGCDVRINDAVLKCKKKNIVMLFIPCSFFQCMFRHDAMFGFLGGIIDPGESVIQGLNREMKEEIDLDLDRFKVIFRPNIFFGQVATYLGRFLDLILKFFKLLSRDDVSFC